MTDHTPFPCPCCRTSVPADVDACSTCGLPLVGPDAVRLDEIRQQIASLQREAEVLTAKLIGPAAPRGPLLTGDDDDVRPGVIGSLAPPPGGVSGQQVLLAIGALLLLSAASVFLLVVWFVVGLAGQAAIMVVLTAAAVAGSGFATRRGFPAAAETGAVLGTGLLLIDVIAAHVLGLARLDTVRDDTYAIGASVLVGVLLLIWDRLMPSIHDERPLRPVSTYRPGAVLALSATPWLVLIKAAPSGAPLVIGLGLVSVANAAVAYAADRWLTIAAPPAPHGSDTVLGLPPTTRGVAAIASVGAASAVVASLVAGVAIGYDFDATNADRYTVFVLMLLGPATLALLSSPAAARLRGDTDADPTRFVVPAVGLAAIAGGIPVIDLSWYVLVLVSVAVAGLVIAGDHLLSPVGTAAATWVDVTRAALRALQPLLYLMVVTIVLTERTTVRDLTRYADHQISHGALFAAVPAAAWAATGAARAVRSRTRAAVLPTQLAAFATVATALVGAPDGAWVVVMLLGMAAEVGLGCLAARRVHDGGTAGAASTPDVQDAASAPPDPTFRERAILFRGSFWATTEASSVLFGSLFAAVAIGSASRSGSSGRAAATLIVVGVLVLVYAASPGRLPTSYLGSLAISGGTWVLSSNADVAAIEVYTAPLAFLLAGIGFVQWSRHHDAPTRLTMAPALSAAMGPTLLVGWSGDDARLVASTLVAVVVLLVGLTRGWEAPVTSGAVVLVFVGVTQGGPLIGYVPGWVTLASAGAVLLTAGVAWERAVLTGRRANTWYSALR